jgi:hypothetical protein
LRSKKRYKRIGISPDNIGKQEVMFLLEESNLTGLHYPERFAVRLVEVDILPSQSDFPGCLFHE